MFGAWSSPYTKKIMQERLQEIIFHCGDGDIVELYSGERTRMLLYNGFLHQEQLKRIALISLLA